MTAAARDLWRRVSRALGTLVRPGSVSAPDEDLKAELEAHIGLLADDHARTGMTAREASRRAHLEVGGITQIREMARDRCSSTWLDGCRRDLHFAGRSLRATPTFTLVGVLSIALSIGASTAIFSVLNGLALKPLPVEQPEQLVRLSNARSALSSGVYNYAILDQIRQLGAGFEGALAFACCVRGQVTTAHTEETVDEMLVSGDFFTTLGVRPHLGRLLSVEDDRAIGGAAGPTAVISYALWQRLGHPADIVGRSMAMGRVPVTVVGVTPPTFFGPEVGRRFDVALPIRAQRVLDPANPLGDDILHLQIWLRLRHDTPLPTAVTALRAAQPRIRQATMPGPALPGNWLSDPFTLVPVAFGTSVLRDRFERPLWALMGLAGLVLLITCANLANLSLARGLARGPELGLRLALGASRRALVRQLTTESVVVVIVGAVGGLLLGHWASRALAVAVSTTGSPVVIDLALDWRVAGVTVVAIAVSTILCGIIPAIRASHVEPTGTLNRHARVVSVGSARLSHSAVVIQVAISLVLVVAAGLFIRTVEGLSRAPAGFDREDVLVAVVNPSRVPAGARNAIYHRLVQAVAAVTGVKAAGGSLNPPLLGTIGGQFVVSRPGSDPPPEAAPIREFNEITPGWLQAYGTRLLAGRDIDARDTAKAESVMLVNEAFVRRILDGREALGTTLALTSRQPPLGDVPMGHRRIVGIVANTVHRSLRDGGQPTIYMPLAQRAGPLMFASFFITLRAVTGSPMLLTRQVDAAARTVDPNLTIQYRPVTDQVRDLLIQDRVIASLAAYFGVLALLLAGLGLYAVASYTVTRQRQEIGLRLALGATPTALVTRLLSRVGVSIISGVSVGAGVSLWASRFIAPLVYGLEPTDPATFISAIAVLGLVGVSAAWLPASRAVRLDPAVVLRES